ncbi:hypothetical protein N431DRAFT_136208 [Stipitochalara longipes BDJ]|nr:hypothetical protein N431DRAFT_136208 [Stipitochalara longipes BDJ]
MMNLGLAIGFCSRDLVVSGAPSFFVCRNNDVFVFRCSIGSLVAPLSLRSPKVPYMLQKFTHRLDTHNRGEARQTAEHGGCGLCLLPSIVWGPAVAIEKSHCRDRYEMGVTLD